MKKIKRQLGKHMHTKVTAVVRRQDLYRIGQGCWQLGLRAGLFPEVDGVGLTQLQCLICVL